MHIVLSDQGFWRQRLLPLVFTRPVSDLRVGILTIAEKWAKQLQASYSFQTAHHLAEKYPIHKAEGSNDCLVIKGNICPDTALCEAIERLSTGEVLFAGEECIALRTDLQLTGDLESAAADTYRRIDYLRPLVQIRFPEDIIVHNGAQLALDFELLTAGRVSAPLSATNRVLGDRIFVEEGAMAECSIFNSLQGPIFLGRHSSVWEGSMIRGGFALGEGAKVKMGTTIYSNVSVGPGCQVGGELNNSVLWGNSNKGHHGYMGNSVVGEWCNWGAGTSNSNLKNNYTNVKVYDYLTGDFRNSGFQKYGVVMADHVKCAINTAFNTGTYVGVGANVFGGAVPPKFVPDFSWGIGERAGTYELPKLFEAIKLVFALHNRTFDETEQGLLATVFETTKSYHNS